MNITKILTTLILAISVNTYAASWEVYPNKDELEVINGQPDIVFNGIKQKNICKAMSMVLGHNDPSSSETIYKTKQMNPTVSEVIKVDKETNYSIGYLCKIEKGKIIFSHVSIGNEKDGNKKIGRWRQHQNDQKIAYTVDAQNLYISVSEAANDKEIKKVPFKITLINSWSSTAPASPTPITGAQWFYSQKEDPMGKGSTSFAHVISTNVVLFDSPYDGPQHATLTLRTHPRHGKDIILNIERGQFLCRSYEDCNVLVRFDDQKAVTYAGVGPADNSSRTVFIHNYPRFVSSMLKAKRVRITTDVYQEGSPIFEFDVSGFNEGKYKGKQ